jgi:hypothetical protein
MLQPLRLLMVCDTTALQSFLSLSLAVVGIRFCVHYESLFGYSYDEFVPDLNEL